MQSVEFYEGCEIDCKECTLSQFVQIEYGLQSNHSDAWNWIAIQNSIETISIVSNVETSIDYHWSTMMSTDTHCLVDHFHQPQFALKWLSTKEEQTLEKYDLPTFPGYNQHAYIFFACKDKTKSYSFVKYMDNDITTSSEYYPHLEYQTNDFLRFEYNDRYYEAHNFSCPHLLHNPKLFSWTKAQNFCHEHGNSILSEFVDRNQEEEFLSLLHRPGSHMFPIDAVFIGLRHIFEKVSTKIFLSKPFTSSPALMRFSLTESSFLIWFPS